MGAHLPIPDRVLGRILVVPSGCWYWTGALDDDNPKQIIFKIGNKRINLRITLFDWRYRYRPMRTTTCDINGSRCVNPDHVRAGQDTLARRFPLECQIPERINCDRCGNPIAWPHLVYHPATNRYSAAAVICLVCDVPRSSPTQPIPHDGEPRTRTSGAELKTTDAPPPPMASRGPLRQKLFERNKARWLAVGVLIGDDGL